MRRGAAIGGSTTRALAIALVCAVLTIGGWIAWKSARPAGSRDDGAAAFAELRAVRGLTRPFAARLIGGFAYAPAAAPTRGASAADVPVDIRLAAARLEKRLASGPTAGSLAEFAAGALMSGHADAAIAALDEARRLEPRNARVFSDLSAAYLVRSAENAAQPNEDQVRALDAAATAAALDPRLEEAWFNRALAMNGIFPAAAAAGAWDDFLRLDGRTPWAAEARSRAETARTGPAPADVQFLSAPLAAIPEMVRTHPQQAREAFLDEVAPAWGRARIAGDASQASAALSRATAIGDALSSASGDPFAADAVRWMRDERNAASSARAYRDYGAARRVYAAGRYDESIPLFARLHASLAPSDPLRCWTGLQLVWLAFDRRDIGRAMALLGEPMRQASGARYRAAYARGQWLQGLLYHQSNRIDEALEVYRAAALTLGEIGDRENQLAVFTAAADNLRLRGERRQSWQFVLSVLAGSADLTTPVRRYLAFFNAALFAADEGWLRAALAFQDNAVREARFAPSALPTLEGLTTRARLQFLAGDQDDARRTLAEADAALRRIGDDAYASAALDAVRGEGFARVDPRAAEQPLTGALAFFSRAEPAQAARLHLVRGRARLARGDIAGAEADFSEGIADVEHRRLGIRSAELRVSYLDDVSDLFTEMAELQLSAKRNPDLAFGFVERGRARALLDATRAPVLTAEEVQQALPEDVALLEFKSLGSSIAGWVITSAGRHVVRLPASGAQVAMQAEELKHDLPTASLEQIRIESRRLHAAVVEPLEPYFAGARTLVIVADGALAKVPFAALVSSRGRYLIEEHAVASMPSAAAFIASVRRAASTRGPLRRALLVSDPAADPQLFPGLPTLPGAQAEVRALAGLYADARTLSGTGATREAFLAELPRADVLHFAGHAVENAENPRLSALVLAPGVSRSDAGALRADEIAGLRLSRARLVVLAACDTGGGPVTRGEGVHSLARPFLEAGVPNVVATLWKIDDTLSGELFRRFHAHVSRGEDVTQALQAAQLEMLQAGAVYSHPRAWAGVIALGAAGTAVPITVHTSPREDRK